MQRFSVLALTSLLLGLGGATTTATAQELLPSAITTTTSPFTPEQADTVDAYVGRWARELIAGQSPSSISNARMKLLEPMKRPGASVEFKAQYSAEVATAISEGINSDKMLVRLNTLITAAALTEGYGLDLARAGLTDQTTAVRYWAAKAAADALAADREQGIAAERRTAIARAIMNVIGQEKAGAVLEQFYISLAAADTPESRKALLDALHARAADYAENGLTEDLSAEATGLNRVYVRLLYAGKQRDPDEVRRLVAANAKYLQLVRDAMQNDHLSTAMNATVQSMVESAEKTLNWATLRVFTSHTSKGPALAEPLKTGERTQFMFNVGEWLTRLVSDKTALTANDLKLQ